jgi:hypothetical protein
MEDHWNDHTLATFVGSFLEECPFVGDDSVNTPATSEKKRDEAGWTISSLSLSSSVMSLRVQQQLLLSLVTLLADWIFDECIMKQDAFSEWGALLLNEEVRVYLC